MLPHPPLSAGEIAGIVCASIGGILFVGLLLAGALWFSRHNRDLAHFNALRHTDPTRFRNMVWVCRFNGPIVLLMSLGLAVASPGLLFDNSIPWLALRGLLVLCGASMAIGFAYLSWRWMLWGWRTSLATKQD
jgi:hypothetical protein